MVRLNCSDEEIMQPATGASAVPKFLVLCLVIMISKLWMPCTAYMYSHIINDTEVAVPYACFIWRRPVYLNLICDNWQTWVNWRWIHSSGGTSVFESHRSNNAEIAFAVCTTLECLLYLLHLTYTHQAWFLSITVFNIIDQTLAVPFHQFQIVNDNAAFFVIGVAMPNNFLRRAAQVWNWGISLFMSSITHCFKLCYPQ